MLGWQEILIIIAVLAILFFGGRKIPELARGLGQGMREFKQGIRETDEKDAEENAPIDDNREDDDKKRHKQNNASS